MASSIESRMNLAVAGLMIASTSMVKTGAFSWLWIAGTKANRKKMERSNKTLFLFKIFLLKKQYPIKERDCQIILKSLNLNPHQILCQNDLSWIDLLTLADDIRLVANWIEMGEEEFFTV